MAPENSSWNSPELLFALTIATANDTVPEGPAIPAYLFANEAGVDKSVIQAGINLYKSGRARPLLTDTIPDGYLDYYPTTWRGFEAWRRMLEENGVRAEDIRPLVNPPANPPGSKPPVVHTASEADEIVKLAEAEKWPSFYVVTHPIQMLRAFACTVTSLVRKQLQIPVFAHTRSPLSGWCLETALNQGLARGIILGDGTSAELSRLKKIYGNRFDIAPAETVLAYLKWRDSDGKFPFPANPFAE